MTDSGPEETPWDDKDPERVIGGYKSQITQITSRLNAARAFLISLGIYPDDINEDGELIQGSPSDLADTRRKAELSDAMTECYRWKSIAETLQGDLQYVFGDEVSFDQNGHILFSEATKMILRVYRTGQEAKARIREMSYSQPVDFLEEAGRSTEGEGFLKRTFGFDFGRKSRSDKES